MLQQVTSVAAALQQVASMLFTVSTVSVTCIPVWIAATGHQGEFSTAGQYDIASTILALHDLQQALITFTHGNRLYISTTGIASITSSTLNLLPA